MRRNARVDANQKEIVEALRAVGASVQHLHTVGQGCPDLLVGFRGKNFLIEVKEPGNALTRDQVIWLKEWRGRMDVVYNVYEALRSIGAKR